MKRFLIYFSLVGFLSGCGMMIKLEDRIFIQQRTSLNKPYPRLDSLLIVANGTVATHYFLDDFISMFREELNKRGVSSSTLFVSYTEGKIDETQFDNRNYSYTLWIYEQDRKLQQLENYGYLVPLAMKLTDNKNVENVWIATSIINNVVKKKYYREKYAGTLALIFRANGIIH